MPDSLPATDRAHDVLRQEFQSLDPIFKPRNVAVIGATENSGAVGRTLLWNLISNPFGGTVFPVNPKRSSVLGIKAYPNIASVPAKVDLAVIVTPAASVPGLLGECVDAGVRGAIIISAGFKEMGPPGARLEQQIMERARGKMRIIGPNCLGVMNPIGGLNATFAKGQARPGKVAFISQSGALCTAVLDWSLQEQVGFSAFVSVGSMLDVGWGDLIDYLGDDPKTNSILIYMESIGDPDDARSFLSAAREVALNKPIIVIKPGRSEAAAKAAASHTGSLTGSDEVLDAAFRRVGVLRVNDIADLFSMAETLAKQPRPRGNRLCIVTNAGGPGVLATDALVAHGGDLAPISPEILGELSSFLPAAWSRSNPVDVLGDAGADRYAKALEICARDPNNDGVLVILTPQDMTESTETAEALRKHAHVEGKPVLASWMGGVEVEAGKSILNRAGVPTFEYPDIAARAFCSMVRYAYNLRALYETPSMDERALNVDREKAGALIAGVRASGRTLMDEFESKQLMAAYGIPTVPTAVARSVEEALATARQMGYPAVLKLYSTTITHKTNVGGVKLNLRDDDAVRRAFAEIHVSVAQKAGAQHFQGVTVQPMIALKDAYEIILGSAIDPQFGPVLLFGAGGQLVEVFKDRALGLPPLNATLARRMMERTKIYRALQGVRGRAPVDLEALEHLLVRFSQMVIEQPWIREIDINPLAVSAEQMIALDARVVLHPADTPESALPRSAIRAYPTQYVTELKGKDGQAFTIRPIRPEDEPLMVKFHQKLSEHTVRLRYFYPMQLDLRTAHERLTRVCFADYDREMALVVEERPAGGADREIIGVGRLSKLPGTNDSEFALLISDEHQRKGLGSRLLGLLVQIARDEGLSRISADILAENTEMQRVAQKLGFRITRDLEDSTSRAELVLQER
ncbi:bifunctional acetate--CoA ligase family protein/GNAT family N-acetyltransferase [Sorangium sp. So ce590]|uniref:bifunctional acetate--CoA ligase family protein/GNAT family N-acetyltransferase n=1 Tax=Sorangium sp. So ce590 TaxID=3133317 RepID=UPI003F5E5CFC